MRVLIASALVIVADQVSKYWIKHNYVLHSTQEVLGSFFKITYVENPGVAFGISVGKYLPFITLISVFAILLVVYYLYQERHKSLEIRLGLALILGGAIGNMIDRCLMIFLPASYSGVVDFIDIGFNHYRWYIFNVADSAVTVGIVLIMIHSLLNQKNTVSASS